MHNFDPTERNRLVEAYWESYKQTSWPIFQTLTDGQVGREYAKQDRLLEQYAEILPFVPVSRCPYTDKVFKYAFDPFGLDGMWWSKGDLIDFPPPLGAAHFRVWLGAINFHGREPAEAQVHHTVLPGPSVPFVVPRLLELPTVKAVISTIDLPQSDTAYMTCYFSESPIHGGYLHQPWARESYQVFDESGTYESWSKSNDVLDFDLRPWIDKGLVHWINPDDDEMKLTDQGVCPFENIPGDRFPQLIQRGQRQTLSLPVGDQVDPTD